MRSQGFTLIELMLVVVILGLATSVVMLSMPAMTSTQSGEQQLSKLSSLLALVQEQAIMQGSSFGLYIDDHHYQIMALKPQASGAENTDFGLGDSSESSAPAWVLYLHPRWQTQGDFTADEDAQLSMTGLTLDEAAQDNTSDPGSDDAEQAPQILILPGGEITPFTLSVTDATAGKPVENQLAVTDEGEIVMGTESQSFSTGASGS